MAWQNNRFTSLTGIKLVADNGSVGGYVLPSDLNSGGTSGTINTGTAGQLAFYLSSGTALSPLTLGTGFSLSGGTLNFTAASGLTSFNTRTGAVTLSLADVTAATGTGATAASNLVLGGAALLNVGTTSGTVAAGNDGRIVGAAPLASPAFTGAPTAPTPTTGTGIAIKSYVDTAIAGVAGGGTPGTTTPLVNSGSGAVGTSTNYSRADHVHPVDTSRLAAANNLSDVASASAVRTNIGLGAAALKGVSGTGTLVPTISGTVTTAHLAVFDASGNLVDGGAVPSGSGSIPVATTTTLGGVKSDGATVSIAGDGTLTVNGVSLTSLTDAGTLASTDADIINRAGTDLKTTLSARSTLVRRTPAGSRTITFTAAGQTATLTATDNDKTVVVTGSFAGSLAVDGTITDGFRAHVINHTGSPLTLSGISGIGSGTSIANNTTSTVTLANSATEATIAGAATIATTSAAGVVKPDGTTLAVAGDGTLSVILTATNSLPAATAPAGADTFAGYSAAGATEQKYTLTQIATFARSTSKRSASLSFGMGAAVAAGTIYVSIPNAAMILSVSADANFSGGGFAVAASIGGTSITGASMTVASGSAASGTATAANTITAGGEVALAFSSVTGTPTSGTLTLTWQE